MTHIPSWYDYLFQDYGYEEYSDNYMNKSAFVKFYTKIDSFSSSTFWLEVQRALVKHPDLIPPIEALLDYYLDYFTIDKEIKGFDERDTLLRKWMAIITEERTIAEMISMAGAVAGIVNSVNDIANQSVYLEVDRALNEALTDYIEIEGDKIRRQGIRGKTEEELYEYLNDTNRQIMTDYDWYGKEEREKALAAALSDEDADLDNPDFIRETLSKIMVFEDEE